MQATEMTPKTACETSTAWKSPLLVALDAQLFQNKHIARVSVAVSVAVSVRVEGGG